MFWRKQIRKRRSIDFDFAKRAIVRVGAYGRGFVCGHDSIITSVSCLPKIPAFRPFEFDEHGTFASYQDVLRRFDDSRTASASCQFADLISNIAILSEHQDLHYGDDYKPPMASWEHRLRIGTPRGLGDGVMTFHQVWILGANNDWISCTATLSGGMFRLYENPYRNDRATDLQLQSAQSGSPIFDETGAAIGMIQVPEIIEEDSYFGSHPALAWTLPGLWLRPGVLISSDDLE